jgi:hypothetical protein
MTVGEADGETRLFANSWFIDGRGEPVVSPAKLMIDKDYRFLFAIERMTRTAEGISHPFKEPPSLLRNPVTDLTLEVCSSILRNDSDTRSVYAKREVRYRRGVGFAPQAFDLKPMKIGSTFITVRLIAINETIYREVIEAEVVAAQSKRSSRQSERAQQQVQ